MKCSVMIKSGVIIWKIIPIILILILTFTFTSCEKDNDIPLGTISVLIDGRQRSFNNGAKVESLTVQGGYGIRIHGFRRDAGSSNEITIDIVSPNSISAKTYSEGIYGNAVLIKYSINMILWIDDYLSDSTATVTISEINSAHVKGTFSGKVIYQPDINPEKELRKGVFNVSF